MRKSVKIQVVCLNSWPRCHCQVYMRRCHCDINGMHAISSLPWRTMDHLVESRATDTIHVGMLLCAVHRLDSCVSA